MKKEETKKNILKFIISFMEEHGYPPSCYDIAEGIGHKSRSSATRIVNEMIEEGMLISDAGFGIHRSYTVPGYRFASEEVLKSIYNKALEDFVNSCYEWNQESSKRIPYDAVRQIADKLERKKV